MLRPSWRHRPATECSLGFGVSGMGVCGFGAQGFRLGLHVHSSFHLCLDRFATAATTTSLRRRRARRQPLHWTQQRRQPQPRHRMCTTPVTAGTSAVIQNPHNNTAGAQNNHIITVSSLAADFQHHALRCGSTLQPGPLRAAAPMPSKRGGCRPRESAGNLDTWHRTILQEVDARKGITSPSELRLRIRVPVYALVKHRFVRYRFAARCG